MKRPKPKCTRNRPRHRKASQAQDAQLFRAQREHVTAFEAWAWERESLRAERDNWIRIADGRGRRLEQIASIVAENKTALGFDPVCGNEILDAVLMMRERATKAEAEAERLKAEVAAVRAHRETANG